LNSLTEEMVLDFRTQPDRVIAFMERRAERVTLEGNLAYLGNKSGVVNTSWGGDRRTEVRS